MIAADLSISLGGNVVLAVLLVAGLIGLAVLFYRFTLPPLPPRRRMLFSALRSCSLVLLLLLFFEPLLRFIRTIEQQPAIAILIDDSQSMSIRDNAGDRAAAIRKLLGARYLSNLPAETKYFRFASKLQPISPSGLDSIQFSGEATNIGDALASLKDRLTKENIQSVVLISDGNYTIGKNPLYDAEAIGVPVFTVGIGDTTEQKDLLVANVLTNNLVYAETRVPVDVTIKSSGFDGEKVEVTVSEGTEVLDRKLIVLQAGTRDYPVKLSIEPKEEGTKKYTVGVSKLPGELTDKNNARPVFVKVLKSKLRVLMFAGAPSPDVSAVRQSLAEDEHFSVHVFVQKSQNEFYEGSFSRAALDSADCIVLVGFPSQATSNSLLQQLRDIVDQEKKPLLFVNGKTVDYGKLQSLEPFLPFSWSGVSAAEVNVFPSVSERQKTHPLINLEGTITADSWQQLPPIFKTQTVFRSKAEADILASVKTQNIILNEPLVAIRAINRQKSFAITGHGIWQWRLLAQGNSQTEKFLPLLLTNAVRWLTTRDEGKNVRVVPTKEMFTTDEPVEFTAQVYDEQLRPADNAEMKVELQRGKETIHVALNAIGSGRYEGSIEGVGEGDYTFVGKATADGKSYGEDRGRFTVGQVNAEFLETRMNKQLLEQIAFRTGGKYYNHANAANITGDLGSSVKFAPKELVQTSEIELWNWQYLIAILVVLFGVEWFLRKRSGML